MQERGGKYPHSADAASTSKRIFRRGISLRNQDSEEAKKRSTRGRLPLQTNLMILREIFQILVRKQPDPIEPGLKSHFSHLVKRAEFRVGAVMWTCLQQMSEI